MVSLSNLPTGSTVLAIKISSLISNLNIFPENLVNILSYPQ